MNKYPELKYPRVDLNDPDWALDGIDDPIEKFNAFIYKWCPDFPHLIDSDYNDGELIRDMIGELTNWSVTAEESSAQRKKVSDD